MGPDISKEHSQGLFDPSRWKALCFFRMLNTIRPMTQHHIPVDLNHQQRHCEKLKSQPAPSLLMQKV
jgi:hypothetical protein